MHAYAYANANAMQLRTKHLKCYSCFGLGLWPGRQSMRLFMREHELADQGKGVGSETNSTEMESCSVMSKRRRTPLTCRPHVAVRENARPGCHQNRAGGGAKGPATLLAGPACCTVRERAEERTRLFAILGQARSRSSSQKGERVLGLRARS
jgi:hypothetical protein